MAFVIRNYTHSDFDRLVDFYGQTAEYEPLLKNSYSEYLIQKLKRPDYDPSKNLFLARHKNELVGCADLVFEAQIKRAIFEIFVCSSFRRRGLGGELLDALLRRCRDLGASVLQANVSEFKSEAPQFLHAQNFRSVRYFHTLQMILSKNMLSKAEKEGIELKHFKTGEEDKLADLQNRVFTRSWGFCPNSVEEIKYYLQLTGCHIDEVKCIEDKGRAIGYVWSHRLPQKPDGRHVRIHMFGVDPEYRGKGVGKHLLQTALCRMGKHGFKTVELTVDSENIPAVSLYDSLGFKLKSRGKWFERVIAQKRL